MPRSRRRSSTLPSAAELPKLEDDILESIEEHHVLKWTLEEIMSIGPDDERYDAKVTVMMEQVRHHVEEEETDWFPKVRAGLPRARLKELGDELQRAKRRATYTRARSRRSPLSRSPFSRSPFSRLGACAGPASSTSAPSSASADDGPACSTRRCPAVDGGGPLAALVRDRGRARRVRGPPGPARGVAGRARGRRHLGDRRAACSNGWSPRRRPPLAAFPFVGLRRRPTSSSMPSGHAASAAAFATAAAIEMPALAVPLGALAGAVGYSRIYNGVHYPGDVLLGGAIGAGVAVATLKVWPRADSQPGDGPARPRQLARVAGEPSADGAGLTIVINPSGALRSRQRPDRRTAGRAARRRIVALDDGDDLVGAAQRGRRRAARSGSSAATARSMPRPPSRSSTIARWS